MHPPPIPTAQGRNARPAALFAPLQVARAKSHVQKGAQQLVAARQSQKSTRKWAIIGIIFVLIVVAIIILFVV